MRYKGTAKLKIITKRRKTDKRYTPSVIDKWDDTRCTICVLICAESEMTTKRGKLPGLKKLLATLESALEVDSEEMESLREEGTCNSC